ncbi:MAG: response regulator [Desulfobacteraceae bacterium]|jgi:signal transduction histidine kinase/FixJ family two-component response regulator|nr:response regulator [Desulfobacteraceae bacterium]
MQEKILLVDDEEGIRKVLGISLMDIGYQVFTAKNGKDALAVFREHRPPIVLTDIKMPHMDGIDLLQQIKAESPDTEVIMLTGHGDMDLAIKCLKLEATDFITKPINDDVLDIALKRANDRISMRAQLRAYTENLETLVREQTARLMKTERLAAVGQAVEGLSSALRGIAGDLDAGINCFNELPCFVAIHNRHQEIIAINPLYRERLGDHVGKASEAAYPPDGVETSPVKETFATGTGKRCRVTVVYADGTRGPVMVHTAPIRDSHGDVELVVEIGADIGEVRRLQERLQATQQRYQQLFDEAPCYITVQNPDLTIQAANRRFQEDFDLIVGTFCHKIYKNRDDACPDCPVARTFADGQSHQCEMEVTSKRGETYRVLIQTAPIRDLAGNITHVMEMSTNITRTRRLEDQLASLGLMIGSVSHGIKGLLTGLDGGMYLLDSGFKKENQQQIREGWDTVRFMVNRIRGMVLDILYYAKEKDLKWERVDVLGFAQEVLRTVGSKLKDREITLSHRFDTAIGHFEVDAGIVRSALTNIIENAVEACRSDQSGRPHEILMEVTQDADSIYFNVTDNGIGMDEATRAKVFTPFCSSKGDRGTGLGLFISNRILSQHGGGISLESEPETGSRFSIKVPKKVSSAAYRPRESGKDV